ncbi:MAG: PaaI family thioesterase [Alphaproteobacteria bacterium]|nr:PaaI family thioesterase [Alphaproteobacteria bacterium]MCB9931128.1 PaaI family thioesterase [Alphaproteobacteria bacterium]
MPTRTIRYTDPETLAEAARDLPYLELLHRMKAGTLPRSTMMESLDLWMEEAEAGRVVFAGTPHIAFSNPLGTLHGGWYASLLDSVLGSAIQSTLPAGKGQTTLEFKINMVRAARLDGRPVRCEARARHVGRRTGTAEGEIVDADGKLLAHGSTTCLILDF